MLTGLSVVLLIVSGIVLEIVAIVFSPGVVNVSFGSPVVRVDPASVVQAVVSKVSQSVDLEIGVM